MQYINVKFYLLILFSVGLPGLQAQTVKDIEGNVYPIVTIGTQVWMAENLKTTKFCNGDSIGTTSPSTLDITNESAPGYQWAYDGNESNAANYGRLYTWYTVTDNRKICPKGWHIPTDAEWTILTDYLTNNDYGYDGNRDFIGKSLAFTSGWITDALEGNVGNDQITNNKSGFSAVSGGYRYGNGSFNGFGRYGYWWSSSELYLNTAWYRSMSYYSNDMHRDSSSKQNGISVRCLRDK